MSTLFSPIDMTSNTAPSPFVASSSSNPVGYAPWNAFDGTGGGCIVSAPSGWVEIDIGVDAAWVLSSYQVAAGATSSGRAPKDWTLQGSNDGSSWTTLDTQTGVTGWGSTNTYTVTPAGSYRYFRINITANNGDGSLIEVDRLLLSGNVAGGTTPQTISFPAISGVTLAATASSGLAVSYSVTSGPGTISGSGILVTGAGTITVQATQAGNSTYAAATPVSQTLVVIDFAPHDLTSDTSHPPYVASASSVYGGYLAYAAFNGSGGSWLGTGAGVDYLQLDTGAAYRLFAYAILGSVTGSGRGPSNWTMQGSNDGATWATLDTQTGHSWGSFTTLTLSIASPGTAYRYFRLHITANNGDTSFTEVDQLYLYGAASSGGVPKSQRGNIAYDQIRATDRTGNGNQLLTYSPVPATATSAGVPGQIAFDSEGNWYWCYAANQWARIGPAGYGSAAASPPSW